MDEIVKTLFGKRPCQNPTPKSLKHKAIGPVTGKFQAIPVAEIGSLFNKRAQRPCSTQLRAVANVQPSSNHGSGI